MRKWIFFLFFLLLLVGGGYYAYNTYFISYEVPELEVPGKLAPVYVKVGKETGIPWYYLAAIDEVENKYEQVEKQAIVQRAKQLKQALGNGKVSEAAIERAIATFLPQDEAEQVITIAESYKWATVSLDQAYQFPFREEDRELISYGDTWGAGRSYGGERKHEGTDLMAPEGTPILSVSNGKIISKGWNTLGGWRLTIQDEEYPQMIYYYAHLSRYSEGLEKGDRVKKGEVIGYVGDSGYGPEGTTGQFAPHLHFGIYVRPSLWTPMRKAINPYPFLKVWEQGSE